MLTYEDLVRAGEDDIERARFCRRAVENFKGSKEYREARDGEAYYNKHNITIEKFQKFLYSVGGQRIQDIWSANYKLKTLFFRRLITQQVQYVLGNGVTLNEVSNKERLGADFDFKLQAAAKKALVSGRAFGFWNLDHLEVFGFADTPSSPGFVPLYSDETFELKAGIRYWFKDMGESEVFRFTLYEPDGYTEYAETKDKVEVLEPKRGYKRVVGTTDAGGTEFIIDENYTTLPIVCLYGNDTYESELNGIRECIDCYDFIKSGFANAIDDTADFYWILKNTGGMDDVDLAQFVKRMRTVRANVVDGDAGVDVEAHTIAVPVDARSAMLELLRKDIYEDFQALDVSQLSAAAKTTQEIQAAYQAQDNKCADFEYYVLDFVQKILKLAGIDDNPTFTWNRVVNQHEQTQMILEAATFLPQEMVIKKLPFLTPEEADEAIKQMDRESEEMFNERNNGDLGGKNTRGEDYTAEDGKEP